MNRHDKLFTIIMLGLFIVSAFCIGVITYCITTFNTEESSVVLIESHSIVEEQKLLEKENEITQLTKTNSELKKENKNLQEENEQLKKSTALVTKNGNYSFE